MRVTELNLFLASDSVDVVSIEGKKLKRRLFAIETAQCIMKKVNSARSQGKCVLKRRIESAA